MSLAHFSPKQVAAAMLVSESSVKRWCDRGLISTFKTAGGHRRITVESLSQFLLQQHRTLAAPEELGFSKCLSMGADGSDAEVSESLSDDFTQGLIAGDEVICKRIVRQAYQQHRSITKVAELLIARAMRDVGDCWECGTIDMFQERYGCEICFRMIDELAQFLPSLGPIVPVAIGGSPAGDPYQLPSRLVELVLRESGWNAKSLGNNLPFTSFRRAVDQFKPALVWLSISTVDDPDAFADQFNQFADGLAKDIVLIVGGRALDDDLRPRLRYTGHCDNLRQLADLSIAMRRHSIDGLQSNA